MSVRSFFVLLLIMSAVPAQAESGSLDEDIRLLKAQQETIRERLKYSGLGSGILGAATLGGGLRAWKSSRMKLIWRSNVQLALAAGALFLTAGSVTYLIFRKPLRFDPDRPAAAELLEMTAEEIKRKAQQDPSAGELVRGLAHLARASLQSP